MRIALYAGSFNPFTRGHQSLVDRALPLFDRIIIGIGVNDGKQDSEVIDLSRRIRAITDIYADVPDVEVYSYEGLTVDFAKEMGASFLLRGVRTASDFEYERILAYANRDISGLETVLLFTLPEDSYISSSLVRTLEKHGLDISSYLPVKKEI